MLLFFVANRRAQEGRQGAEAHRVEERQWRGYGDEATWIECQTL
jgi:hypothetical protein